VAILSKNSVGKRGSVQKELKQALDVLDEFPENEVFLIPARISECDPRTQVFISYAREDS
jgi:hypothetical protein